MRRLGLDGLAVLSVSCLSLLAGCQSDVRWEGPEDKLVGQVKAGKMSKAEVIHLFGEPAKIETAASGREVLQYEAVKTKHDKAFTLFGNMETTRREKHFYSFEIDHGVVVRKWKTKQTLEKDSVWGREPEPPEPHGH